MYLERNGRIELLLHLRNILIKIIFSHGTLDLKSQKILLAPHPCSPFLQDQVLIVISYPYVGDRLAIVSAWQFMRQITLQVEKGKPD